MRKYLLSTILACIGIYTSANETVYLSHCGSDNGNGTQARPFCSLNRAIEGRLAGESSDTLFVIVQSGTYYMNRPFTLNGSSSRPIVIKSQGAEKPSFLGGISIKGWEKCENRLYRAYIPEVKRFGFTFEQFYVNGKRATLARTPNEGWLMVKSSKEYPLVKGSRFADYATQKIYFYQNDWETLQKDPEEDFSHLKFRFYHKWSITQKQTEYIDQDSVLIYIKGQGMAPWNPIDGKSRYIMTDYKSALDCPGEWYLDRQQGYLYYMPLPDENMAEAVCFAPTLSQWVRIEGKQDAPIKNIFFDNLSFSYTSHLMPKDGIKPSQAAVEAEAGIMIDFAENIIFTDCEFMHTGAYAMWLRRECHNNKIEHCYMADLGGGGIKIGEPCFRNDGRQVSKGNRVDNCIITHAGTEMPSAVGVALLLTADNWVTHNEISDLRYSGISVGWVWGYNRPVKSHIWGIDKHGEYIQLHTEIVNPAVRNIIEYNHIHHIGWGELSDMGAIYTLGESPGTRVSHNVIHDVWTYDYGGWGLYTDEGSSDIEMSHNLVYRCKSGGFHQHYGRGNTIENNIFAFGHFYQVQYTRPEEHTSFSFKHNIIIYDKGEVLAGNAWKTGKLDIDQNLYWGPNEGTKFGKRTFKEWKKERERHSLQADPQFVNSQQDNFRFKSSKSIRKIGFKQWDYSKAGVYGSDVWKRKALLPQTTVDEFKKAVALRMNR